MFGLSTVTWGVIEVVYNALAFFSVVAVGFVTIVGLLSLVVKATITITEWFE